MGHEFVYGVGFANLAVVWVFGEGEGPVRPYRHRPILHDEHVRGGQLVYAFKHGLRRGHKAVAEQVVERLPVGAAAERGEEVENGAYLGSKGQFVTNFRVVQRFNAKTVADEEEGLGTAVPQGKSKHAAQPHEGIRAPFLVGVHNRFGVGAGAELVSGGFQLGAQGGGVHHLAVVGDPDGAVFIAQRLVTVCQVDDAEPPRRQPNAVGHKNARVVWATVVQQVVGLCQPIAIELGGEDASDAAHWVIDVQTFGRNCPRGCGWYTSYPI